MKKSFKTLSLWSKKLKYLASFTKTEICSRITNILEVPDSSQQPNNVFVELSPAIYNFLKQYDEIFTLFGLISFPNGIQKIDTVELLNLDAVNEYLNNEDEFLVKKKEYVNLKAQALINEVSRDQLSHLKFCNFIIINNILASRGYFITDENREEKYLEVVSSDDNELLELLRKYLEAYDCITGDLNIYNVYIKLMEDIQEADTIEDVNKLYETFKIEYGGGK